MDTSNDQLIRHVMGSPKSSASIRMADAGIDWYAVTAELGPARFGFDFELVEIVRMEHRATVIDLQPRASYALHILNGSCLVAWRDRSAPGSLRHRNSLTTESPEEFQRRIGRVSKTGAITEKNPELTYAYIPVKVSGDPGTQRRELFLATAFEVTLISQTKDVLLVVFSSDGPGNGSNTRPGAQSTS